jgi:transposase
MIQLTPHLRILVAIEPTDFRRGIDGLCRVCRQTLDSDGQGFWLCQKRLSAARFRFWPAAGAPARRLEPHELQVLLACGDPGGAQGAPPWRPIGEAFSGDLGKEKRLAFQDRG